MPDCTFKKSQRLLNASDFSGVFDNNKLKIANTSLLILAKPTDGCQSRLGLVVAKKNIPTAVQRNLLKRVVRETFRKQKFEPPLDIVFLARRGARLLSAQQLTLLLKESWGKLAVRCERLESKNA